MCKVCLIGGVSLFFLNVFYSIINPVLPVENDPIFFYSNQSSDDFKILFKKAIQQTQKSLFLQIYGCTDPYLIDEIKKALKRGVLVNLFYDHSASGSLNKTLPCAKPIPTQGLMHKKILISDKKLIFIGSANFTPTSLRMHDNLVVGLYQKELATFILESLESHLSFKIGTQSADFWHLPDFQNECLERILSSIQQARKTIHLAIFTFTHPKIIQALISAKRRGVNIYIAIDWYSSQGASKKAVATLIEAGITPYIGQKEKLLHHKWALIDQSTLFLGSANWTKSAFNNNEDCVFSLQNLTEKQSRYFIDLWDEIKKNSLQIKSN